MFYSLLLALVQGGVVEYCGLMVFLEAEEERNLAGVLLAQKMLY